jgi:uncharacterized protein YidB (DUF937 family)
MSCPEDRTRAARSDAGLVLQLGAPRHYFLTDQLAEQVVDKLTPEGELPSDDAVPSESSRS